MMAAVLYGKEHLQVEPVSIPKIDDGDILVQVRVALTCGTDVKVFRRGYHARMIVPPAVFGHELAGDVVAVGQDVKAFKVGERVVAANSAPCEECFLCRRGVQNLCEDLLFNNGAYADRKSTRLNSSHLVISYAVFCLKKKKTLSARAKPVAACIRSPRQFLPTKPAKKSSTPARGGWKVTATSVTRGNTFFFFFNDTATTEIYTLSLHDALPICAPRSTGRRAFWADRPFWALPPIDRKSTRLNSSHLVISYAVFCLKKKTYL